MDDLVRAAMARWPQVPAARGWLSLSARGVWHLHANGLALGQPDDEPGFAVSHAGLIAFIGRNYHPEVDGRWFFQNGPQRVYLRLDGAPWILRSQPTASGVRLQTHTGAAYPTVSAWYLDEHGSLYAQSALGAGLVHDHDLAELLQLLALADSGQSLLDYFAAHPEALVCGSALAVQSAALGARAPLRVLEAARIPKELGFCKTP